jgi:hypothetical protein
MIFGSNSYGSIEYSGVRSSSTTVILKVLKQITVMAYRKLIPFMASTGIQKQIVQTGIREVTLPTNQT